MIQSAIRRSVPAILFAFLLAAPAMAQSVTGTDPCPKGLACTAGTKTAVTTTKSTSTTGSTTTSSATSTSDTSAAMQVLMSLLGLS